MTINEKILTIKLPPGTALIVEFQDKNGAPHDGEFIVTHNEEMIHVSASRPDDASRGGEIYAHYFGDDNGVASGLRNAVAADPPPKHSEYPRPENITHVDVRKKLYRAAGNTYHRVRIFFKDGSMLDSGKTYGYGNAWEQTVREQLNLGSDVRYLSTYFQTHGISHEVEDVTGKL